MGAALWVACGAIAFLVSRFVAAGRSRSPLVELVAAMAAAFALGITATMLDFGGWKELDWRAAAFVFFGSAAVIAALRLLSLIRQPA